MTKRRSGGGQKSTSFSGPTKPSKSQPFESSPPHHHETDEEPPQDDIGAQGGSAVPMTEEYKEQVRPFIDLIDKLRASGLDQDVRLPAVAVIGDQSAGKSSALEAISGIQLPRGKGIVTRCPLVLRLKSTVQFAGQWKGHIQYIDLEKQSVSEDIDNPEEVTQYIEKAQNAIAGKSKGISDKLITLDVVSEDVPDLTLIDLPGITRVAVEDQPADIGDQIKDLITKMIEKQETIILTVVPANVDIATNEALQLAKTFDGDGERTLGVVTKPDLIDPGTESELLAVLNNERYHLTKGYTCVKCRGQQKLDDRQTLQEAIEEEEKFFDRNKHFRETDENILGVRNLSKKLTYELVEQIKKSVPSLKEEVEEKLEDTRKRLEKLGTGLPDSKVQITAYILRLLTSYCDHVKHECEHILFKKARDMYNELLTNITAQCPDTSDVTFMNKVKHRCVENRGNELPRFMNYEVFKGLVVELIDRYTKVNNTCLDKVSKMMDRAITEMVDDEFSHLPRLAGEIKKRVTEIRDREYQTCKGRLQEIIEMEKLVFTQDRIYNRDLEALRQDESKDKPNEQVTAHALPLHSMTTSFSLSKTVSRWYDSMTRDHEKTIAVDMCEMIKAFIQVSNRRMVDYVPLTISLHMIENLYKDIRLEVPVMTTEENTIQLAKEDNRIVSERKNLQQKLERLELAHHELTAY